MVMLIPHYFRSLRIARAAPIPNGTSNKAPAKTVLGSGTVGGPGVAWTITGSAHIAAPIIMVNLVFFISHSLFLMFYSWP
jgi:hypothetical protein